MFRAIVSSMIFLSLMQVGTVARAQGSNSTSKINLEQNSESNRKWSGEWQLEVGGDSFSESKDEGLAAVLFFKTAFQYKFASWLRASVKPRVDFFSSRLQERFENDDYKSGARISEAFIGAKPIEQVEIRAGAISQDYLNSPMLISKRRAFPGGQIAAGQDFKIGDNQIRAELNLQHTVPTSSSLNSERQDKEALPFFDTQSVHLSGKSLDALEWRGYAGHYSFKDLPSKVAAESRISGNRVPGSGVPGAQFQSQFDGYFGGTEICACFASWTIVPVVEFQRIYNARAESGFGNAQMWGIGPRIMIGENVLDLRYRRFFIEQDATVAAYNTSFLGGTNRMGDDVEFRLDFPSKKFALIGEWVNAVKIRDETPQGTLTAIFLGVETHYAPF